jgi:hypothetical protein
MMKLLTIVVLFGMLTLGSTMLAADDNTATTTNTEAQVAKLYQLEAAFHAAVSVHNNVTCDSSEVIEQRIRRVLSLFAEDATFNIQSGTPAVDGLYVGRGDLDNPALCPPLSTNPDNRGTICTLYRYVASSFKPKAKWVSLAPGYLTHGTVNGTNGTLYFQCHYFDVSIDPTTMKPLWKAKSHVDFNATVKEINGQWYFYNSKADKVGVPLP